MRHLGSLMGDVRSVQSLLSKSVAMQRESSAKVSRLVASEAAAARRAQVAELRALELELLLMNEQLREE